MVREDTARRAAQVMERSSMVQVSLSRMAQAAKRGWPTLILAAGEARVNPGTILPGIARRSGRKRRRVVLGLSCAPVAQLDRAAASEAVGQKFESSRAHHPFNPVKIKIGASYAAMPTMMERPRTTWAGSSAGAASALTMSAGLSWLVSMTHLQVPGCCRWKVTSSQYMLTMT